MADTLQDRLRSCAKENYEMLGGIHIILGKAADRIDKLGAEIAKLDVCCCGDSIADHSRTTEHSPTSMALNYIADLEDHIDELKLPQWHSIGSAPKDGTRVLLRGNGYFAVAGWEDYDGEWGVVNDIVYTNPTHWMSIAPYEEDG